MLVPLTSFAFGYALRGWRDRRALGTLLREVLAKYEAIPPATPTPPTPLHYDHPGLSHRYDTMRADKQGWRCGMCDRVKPRGS